MIGHNLNEQIKSKNKTSTTTEQSQLEQKNTFLPYQSSDQLVERANTQNQSKTQLITSEISEVVESLQRRFKLQVKKQKELFLIVQTKLKQQILFLTSQNQFLNNQNKDLSSRLNQIILVSELSTQKLDKKYPLITNQVINLRGMLDNLQKQHENCIKIKKQFFDTKQTLEMKIMILQNQNKQLETQCKDLRNKVQSLSKLEYQKKNMQTQIQSLKQQVNSLRVINQEQEKEFNKELIILQKSIQNIQSKNFIDEIPQKKLPLCERSSKKCIQYQANYPEITKSFLPDLSREADSLGCQINHPYSTRNTLQTKYSNQKANLYWENRQKQTFDEKYIIEELYKKNIRALKETENQQLNQPKHQKNYYSNRITGRELDIQTKINRSNYNQVSYAQLKIPSYTTKLSNRRFRYL